MKSLKISETKGGFTLMEVIVTMAIVALVAAFGLGVGISTYKRSKVGVERDTLVAMLYRARSRALNNMYEMPHGLYVDTGNREYVLFRGGTYTSGASTNEEVPMQGDAVSFTGLVDTAIVFGQLDADVVNTGSITLGDASISEQVDINGEGGIIWN